MSQIEILINSLIKMGWKPWGMEGVDKIFCLYSKPMLVGYDNTENPIWSLNPRSFRELVSLESGLWQFCSDNELTKSKTSEYMINRYIKELITREEGDVIDADVLCSDLYHEYRLLESALIPEEEIVDFLLNNIKTKGTSN